MASSGGWNLSVDRQGYHDLQITIFQLQESSSERQT